MNVLILSPGQDVAGTGARLAAALRKHGVTANAMHMTDTYIKYPRDLRWDADIAQKLYDEADVVHMMDRATPYDRFDHGQHKPIVLHHHGSTLRDRPSFMQAEARRMSAVEIVSTVDLLEDAPKATWLPALMDLDAIASKYAHTPRGKVRIAHAPTNRAVKGTAEIVATIERLKKTHDIEFDLIEKTRWIVCLSRKSNAHILIDQLTLGYGQNAIEAWAMGIPVVSGWALEDDRTAFLAAAHLDSPPFVEADEDSLEARLTELIESAELRAKWGATGRAFAEKFHGEKPVIDKLMAVYEAVA